MLESSASPGYVVTRPTVPHGRPHHHIYRGTSSSGKDSVLATISADIKNYTEPGEDLDWTKVADPTERKRLQGIVGGRKYRERRLAAQGKGGSGGNYPGASGVGSYISNGYGPQRPYGYSKHAEDATAREPSADAVMISEDEEDTSGKSGGQAGFQDFYMSLMDSATRKESRARYEKIPTDDNNDSHQPSLTPSRPSPTLLYDLDDGHPEPQDERATWEPNAGDVAFFELDRPMKTAYNMFARSAHDAHRFPAKTRKNVVEKYHLYIRQVWNLLLEQDKTAWRSLAAARGCLSVPELSVKGQHILESQGLLSKFLPHVEPAFTEA